MTALRYNKPMKSALQLAGERFGLDLAGLFEEDDEATSDFAPGVEFEKTTKGKGGGLYMRPQPVTGETTRLNLGDLISPSRPVSEAAGRSYASYIYLHKMTSNATPPSEDWITSYKAAWTWLAKKKSYEWLKEQGVAQHIDTWPSKAQ